MCDPVQQTDLCWAARMTETGLFVHDARYGSTFVRLKGQCPPFFLLLLIPLFLTPWGIWLFFLCFFFLWLFLWLQSSWRSPHVSAHKPSQEAKKFMSCQSLVCSVPSVIAFLVTGLNVRTGMRASGRSIQHACVFFLCVFLIQLRIKVLWDNVSFTVCLWSLRDTNASALLLRTGCTETKSGPAGRLGVFTVNRICGHEKTDLR